MLDKIDPVLSFLAVGSAVKLFFAYINKDKRHKNLVCVGKIAKLTVYPVKSMSGVSLDNVECTQKGLKFTGEPVFDRTFMVVTENGAFITARAYPKLSTVKPKLDGHFLVLEADGMAPLKLPKVSLRDQNKPLVDTKIIYNMEGILQRPLTDPMYEELLKFSAKQGDRVVFHDGSPYMLLSIASLEELNSHLSDKVSMTRFRPNIVVAGTAPFEEDEWDDIWMGDVKFTSVRHCERCTMTTVNPETGIKSEDGEPLKTLNAFRQHIPSYRDGPIFGIHLILDSPNGSVLNVGDHIYVQPKSQLS